MTKEEEINVLIKIAKAYLTTAIEYQQKAQKLINEAQAIRKDTEKD